MIQYLEARKAELKKRGAKGFTLAELLVVVAIIAVLVAIAIPIFTNQLEKAREATDMANVRAAYAAVSSDVLTDPAENDDNNGVTYKADATKGDTYTAFVAATQTKANWQSDKDSTSVKLGGQDVSATIKSADGKGWTIVGNVKDGKVTITADQTKPTN